MGWQIIHDHGIANRQGRHEQLLDIGAKGAAIDWPFQQHGRADAVAPQAGGEACGHPVAVRDRRLAPRAACRCAIFVVAIVSSIKTSLAGSRVG